MVSIIWFLFVALGLAAAAVDVISYRIPNGFVLALTAIFLIVAILHSSEVVWLSHLGSFLLVLGAGVFFYAFGLMGAGDAKLLAAVALWSGVYSLFILLFWISMCGFGAMLVILALRFAVPRFQYLNPTARGRAMPEVLIRSRGIPYGLGIGPGAALASFSFPPWLWHY